MRLTFDELLLYAYAQDFEGSEPSQGEVTQYLSNFFGQPVTSDIDSGGNWTISIGGRAPIPLTFQLDEVVITAPSSGGPRFGLSGVDYNTGLQFWGTNNGNQGGSTPFYTWQHQSGVDTAIPTPEEMKLLAIDAMRVFIGTEYSMGSDNLGILRTGGDYAALERMDCSELVSRYIHAIGITQQVEPMDTQALITFMGNGNFAYHTTNPQIGDIFIWRVNGSGHTGIITGVDPVTGRVTTLEAISESPNGTHPNETFHSVIETSWNPLRWHLEGHPGWGGDGNGYYTALIGI